MDIHDMATAIDEAERLLRRADSVADRMAWVLAPRLHQVSPHILARMKRELQQFNARTQEWKQ